MKKERLDIIYQDENIIAVNKPTDILVIPDQYTEESQTLIGKLKEVFNQKIWVVHRIDRDTTGILVFAKNAEAHKDLSMQFEHSKVRKKYYAILSGYLEEEEGTINKPILISGRNIRIDQSGKESITDFKVLERFKNYTFVEASPLTGRRHQIRIHFWSLGHPLAIDKEYGSEEPLYLSSFKRNYKEKEYKEKPLINRLTLHAAELAFKLPLSDKEIVLEAPMPKDFEIALKQLRKYDAVGRY